jgi:hypothetical protein
VTWIIPDRYYTATGWVEQVIMLLLSPNGDTKVKLSIKSPSVPSFLLKLAERFKKTEIPESGEQDSCALGSAILNGYNWESSGYLYLASESWDMLTCMKLRHNRRFESLYS